MNRSLALVSLVLALAAQAEERPITLVLDLQRHGQPIYASQMSLLPGSTTPVVDAGSDIGFQVTAIPTPTAAGEGAYLQFRFTVPDGFGGRAVITPRVVTPGQQPVKIGWQVPLGVDYELSVHARPHPVVNEGVKP